MPNAAAARPNPLEYQTQRAIVLRAADEDIIRILKQTQIDIIRMLREVQSRPAGIGRDIRQAQLRLVQRNLQQELGKAWRAIGNVVEARRAEAVARSIDFNAEVNKFRLLTGGVADGASIADKIALSEAANAASGIDRMIARTSGASYVPLQQRVYNSDTGIGAKVDSLVNSALVRGLSALEFASEVRQFINPLTPGGVSYAAKRLARTEINNAAHAASIQAVRESPWVDLMEWRLSGSHGRSDVCDRYAKGGPNNDGHYPKTAVPSKPHPQCLCFVIPVTDDDAEFERKLLSGQYNQYLERYRNLQPGQVVRSGYGGGFPAPAPKTTVVKVKPTKTTGTPAKPGAKPPSQAKPPTPGQAPLARVSGAGAIDPLHEQAAKRLVLQGNSLAKARNTLAKEFGITKEEAEKVIRSVAKQFPESAAAKGANLTAVKPAARPASARVTASPQPSAPGYRSDRPWIPNALPEHNLLPERRDISQSARNHINALVQPIRPNRAEILNRELQHQAGLLPDRVVTQLKTLRLTEDLKLNGKAVNGFYLSNEIDLGGHLFSSANNLAQLRSELSGFKTSCGASHTSAQSVLAHEYGHHVDSVLTQFAALRPTVANDFWGSVAKELDLPAPFSASRGSLDSWIKTNQGVIEAKISKYATTNSREFFAEIWREFSGNPNARSHIRAIGLKIQKIAGEVIPG